ncbi:sensor histidine kinase [Amorphoplanes digitatis]|uniref:histidine kinase n=1 Tax=Actinoplanes digitatis TaxID=1868 RepID=A0A7W7HYI1_9ACTN|nr:histidine kinase [Actinoplanes digitatis]MBB4763124.1 signal transduction histidine kinase [Actinoplanes digitatis]GID97156.1 two-component sensor histidine kinase [Actinoplanes digitatis]
MSALLFALLVPGPAGEPRAAARNRLADGIAVTLAFGYGALMLRLGDASRAGAPLPWYADAALGTLGCLALLRRRRRPVAVAAALLPLTAVSVMATGAMLVALFTVAIRRRGTVALLLAAAYVALVPVYYLLHDDPEFPLWVDLVVRACTAAGALGWGMFVGAYRRLTESLREHAARLEAEQQLRVDQARLTERARIAREMHDVLAHRMSMVSLHAGALEVRTDARPEEIAIAAGAIRTSAHEALQELRGVIGVLRDGAAGRPEPPQPGLADVPDLVAGARAMGLTVGYRCEPVAAGPPVLLGRTAYRIVQEGLTNARKHSPGERVDVLLAGAAGDGLRIRITNPCGPAAGPPEVPGAGAGLIGVGERVALAGGRVEYGRRGDAFRLEAWLPWPA